MISCRNHWLAAVFSLLSVNSVYAQSAIYDDLPVGKHSVGFKIFTITDDARLTRPEFNYLGEKNEDDRRWKITVHIWYPAQANSGKGRLTYADYCYNYLLQSTGEKLDKAVVDGECNNRRRGTENWFGKTTDEAWKKLLTTNLLAHADATPLKDKFPLLIGTLRSLSTSVTNEMLASNGYVVAMVQNNFPFGNGLASPESVNDMRFTIAHLAKNWLVDMDRVGTFGFSGSGFSQVVMAMNDYRIKAVADIESGIYMDELFQIFSASDYYKPNKLRAPFLHIFSLDLSKQEKFIDEFESKTPFAKRYRLLLNQPALHHWDFASEGYTAALLLDNRGDKAENIRSSFEISSLYLLNFFNAELKKDAGAATFLSQKPAIKNMHDSLWSIKTLPAGKPAPEAEEFEYIVRNKGVEQAVDIVRATKQDSLSNIRQWFILNRLGYNFLRENKYKEAIAIFQLNTELHPGDANLFDSLAEGYEMWGDKESMKKASENVVALLSKKDKLTDNEKALKTNAEKRLK
jgi:tetratricopeptide (TPR) repeat protein